jgi:hypothetical protein
MARKESHLSTSVTWLAMVRKYQCRWMETASVTEQYVMLYLDPEALRSTCSATGPCLASKLGYDSIPKLLTSYSRNGTSLGLSTRDLRTTADGEPLFGTVTTRNAIPR